MNYKIIELEQGSSEWLEWRKKHLMASETPALFGVGYFNEKELAKIKYHNKETYQSEAMRKGLEAEATIREFAESLTLYNFEPIVLQKGKFGASLDGFDKEFGVVAEYKNSKSGYEALKNGKVSDTYYYQIQHQLMVSGANSCYLFVREPDTGDILWEIVEPKREVFAEIKGKWTKFVNEWKNKEIPEPKMDDSDEVMNLSDELDTILAKKKELEIREKEIKEIFNQKANGENSTLGNYSVSYSNRKTTDYKGFLAFKGLEVDSEFIKESQTVTIRRK